MNARVCDVCGDPIRWGLLPGERWVALDEEPSASGIYVLLSDEVRIMRLPEEAVFQRLRHREVQDRRYSDHHRTCSLHGLLRVTSAPRSRRTA